MAAKKKQGTVGARLAAEKAREEQARADRAKQVAETKAAQKATADRLAKKPTDSRKLVS